MVRMARLVIPDFPYHITHPQTGRPWAAGEFQERLEALSGRTLKPRKRGRKPQGVKYEPQAIQTEDLFA